jgi:hypothetical protein
VEPRSTSPKLPILARDIGSQVRGTGSVEVSLVVLSLSVTKLSRVENGYRSHASHASVCQA